MKPSGTSMRYMTQFRCLGADCIATCCTSWRVYIDQPHYVQLRRKLSPEHPTDNDPRFVLMPKQKRTHSSHAMLVMRPDQTCPFLSAEQLCEVHREHGAEVLPDVCAQYPRSTHRVAGELELSGFISCPEVARLILFEENATEVVATDNPFGGDRSLLSSTTAGEEAAALQGWRALLLDVLDQEAFSVRGRLFAVGAMALRVMPAFQSKKFVLRELRSHIEALRAPDILPKLDALARAHAKPNGFALETVVRALSLRPAGNVRTSYNALMAAVLPTLEAQSDGAVKRVGEHYDIDTEALTAAYVRRQETLDARFGALFQRAQRNFMRHALWSETPLIVQRGQATFALSILVRVAMQQFLFAFHPRTEAALQSGNEQVLRDLMQTVCFSLARELEHNETMMAVYRRAVHERVRALPEAAAIAGIC